VRKRWPDRLEVTVMEYKPLARWGEKNLLAENGEIFLIPKSTTFKLPMFEGPDANASDMMSFYSYAKPLFLTMGLQIERVRMSARGSWSLRLNDGLEIEVGRGEPQQRLARFARLMPQIKNDELKRQLVRADLRYTNGFALSWKAISKAKVENKLPQGNT